MVVMQLSNCVLTPVKVTTGESLLTVLFPQTGFCVNSSFLSLVFFLPAGQCVEHYQSDHG